MGTECLQRFQWSVLQIGRDSSIDYSFIDFYIITKSMRALIGQSAVVYCAGKLMEKSRVF